MTGMMDVHVKGDINYTEMVKLINGLKSLQTDVRIKVDGAITI